MRKEMRRGNARPADTDCILTIEDVVERLNEVGKVVARVPFVAGHPEGPIEHPRAPVNGSQIETESACTHFRRRKWWSSLVSIMDPPIARSHRWMKVPRESSVKNSKHCGPRIIERATN